MSEIKLRLKIERLEEDNRKLLRKLELTEESLRIERSINEAVARRRSANGNGLHR